MQSHSRSPFSHDFHSTMALPLNMSQDLPALSPEDCILQLEHTIDEMKSQDDMTKTLLHDILDRLGPLASNTHRPMQGWAPSNLQTQTPPNTFYSSTDSTGIQEFRWNLLESAGIHQNLGTPMDSARIDWNSRNLLELWYNTLDILCTNGHFSSISLISRARIEIM